jgi:hypothetical protein
MKTALGALALGVLAASSCGAAPVFARAAVGIADGRNCTSQTSPQTIPSPDKVLAVKIRCTSGHIAHEDDYPYPHIWLKRPDGSWQEMPPHEGLDEVLWAPTSDAVVVNGNENAYTNYTVVYRLEQGRWREIALTRAAQRDMVRQFPPCKAFNRDPIECHDIAANPEFNMASLAWTRDGTALIVMGEVPCSSSYGGIMCAVAGYEIGLDGTILDRMSAKQLKTRWQRAMAWAMRDPGPPKYGRPMPGLPTHR